ncbi:hypothetical protein PR048_022334 [Dryococelus australis]|uniref:FLYWCH-type domain-containing protein n=1 Tax=Dryococelus australis TaxID=614101 RepID=A0ABQ9H0P4_9NEOP|nr:hypothetical protein PR048_022334 [Dryococelus australis]
MNGGRVASDRKRPANLRLRVFGSALFIQTVRGTKQLIYEGYIYCKDYCRQNKVFWKCVNCDQKKTKCRARVSTVGSFVFVNFAEHNHGFHTDKINQYLAPVAPVCRNLHWLNKYFFSLPGSVELIRSSHGKSQLIHNQFLFSVNNVYGSRVLWRCTSYSKSKCRARVVTIGAQVMVRDAIHNHEPHTEKIRRLYLESSRGLEGRQCVKHGDRYVGSALVTYIHWDSMQCCLQGDPIRHHGTR